ncbi:molybdopterin molybdotransferase [Sulfobacillus thermosulfidooxidans DSM 9293]|uniref:Molybdopterin molybdenumtransferase n=1 Tax=Sulfobacillus thermosulfidooxidans (strain DSM 9293 / VKM B-1269 / AT-1) TaxID=929705 RepID=A0A1W1W925_SULTA|nr:gephyrin-like molybdotransferase Glp [Sulfobacillus thermosulfidooxidans]SMC02784.1 molybdopterin molybdotransferase [Sulfobacillus thermosulfidooxidans DSM 9293]
MSYISVTEALDLLKSVRGRIEDSEQIPIEQCWGRTLAEEVVAFSDSPPFHRAAMDGYALRAQDTPGTLPILGQVNAGEVFTQHVPQGYAVRIMTGAPLPQELDTVIEQEAVTRHNQHIEVPRVVKTLRNVSTQGSEITRGTTVFQPGQYIGSLEMGLLALSGYATVKVYRKPRVLLVTTGDELQNPGQALQPGHIYNVNRYLFAALLTEAGADVTWAPPAADTSHAVALALSDLTPYDLVITTGGVSVGDKDHVIQFLRNHTRLLFWRVDMHPGKSIAGAEKDHVPILALSGNPGAAMMSWYLIGLPFVVSLYGAYLPLRHISGRLRHPFMKPTRETRYLRARIQVEQGEIFFDTQLPQGSDIITAYRQSEVLAIIPEGSPPVPSGTEVTGLMIPGLGPERLYWLPQNHRESPPS